MKLLGTPRPAPKENPMSNETALNKRSIAGRLALGLVGAISVAALAVPSIASAAGTQTNGTGSGTAKATRLEKACHRIPAANAKVTAHIAKLQADASTRGSIAWLQDRITKAQAKNHTQAVTMLQAKLAERQAALTALQARLTLLTDAAAFCTSHGVTP